MVGRRIGDEFVLVPLAGRGADIDHILNLNRVGTFIWEQLDGRTSGAAIVERMTGRFEVDRDRAEADYLEFLGELREVEAVVRADGSRTEPGA
jgi:Coenzyme PQQ synthesis protein D (PqqD)